MTQIIPLGKVTLKTEFYDGTPQNYVITSDWDAAIQRVRCGFDVTYILGDFEQNDPHKFGLKLKSRDDLIDSLLNSGEFAMVAEPKNSIECEHVSGGMLYIL